MANQRQNSSQPAFNLPTFANSSSTSLMDAVVGRSSTPTQRTPSSLSQPSFASAHVSSSAWPAIAAHAAAPNAPPPADAHTQPYAAARAQGAPPSAYAPSHRSHASGPSSARTDDDWSSAGRTDEWDMLSDGSARANAAGGAEVEELQRKVEKRRSNLPQLTSELAALEAQIKAAEERLARAQAARAPAGTSGATAATPVQSR
ncbi:hypothetical protein Q5752_006026 [Cryptotrichosporon argae]